MKSLIGFWLICVSLSFFICFLNYELNLKDKIMLFCGISFFLAILETGIYLLVG